MNEEELEIIIPAIETLPVEPKVKKKKKGYFDNSEMLEHLRNKKGLSDLLKDVFIIEKTPLTFYTFERMDVYPWKGVEYNRTEIERMYRRVNDEVGKLYIKVAEGMMKRPNFINYPPDQRSEMLSDSLFFMTRAGERYDVNYPNPFAYFSQITFNSFLQSIKNMKKRITTFVYVDHLENFDGCGDYGGDE